MGSGFASAVEVGRCFEFAMKLVAAVAAAAAAGTGFGLEVVAAEFVGPAAEAGCDQRGTVLAVVVGLASMVRRN